MSKLRFSDGTEFDTSGELRTEERPDGWYILGEGKMIPVRDELEGLEIIKNLKQRK